MSGFSVRLVREYNVLFLLSSSVCLASVAFSDHFITNKNICWATYYFCSCDLFVSFSRAVNYIFFSHAYSSLHSSISVQDKK